MLRSLMKCVSRLESQSGPRVCRMISTNDNLKNLYIPCNQESVNSKPAQKVNNQANTRNYAVLKHSVEMFRAKDSEVNDFLAAFPDFVRDIEEKTEEYSKNTKGFAKWFSSCLEYTVPTGKKSKVNFLLSTYKQIAHPDDLTEENLKLCYVAGWCYELLTAALMMVDDIMDRSTTRRGAPCWHTLDGVGISAVNDAFMIENAIFLMLTKHFKDKDYYEELMELFHEMTYVSHIGQAQDMQLARRTVDTFDMDMLKEMMTNKATYYSVYLSLATAMIMAKFANQQVLRNALNIILEIGYFGQTQNDFLDCFGDSDSYKIGTDIQENKCTWLAITAMNRANEAQKQIMRDNYGQNDIEKVNKVKQLYIELGIPQAYVEYEKESFYSIKSQVEKLPNKTLQDVFFNLISRVHQIHQN